MLALLPPMMTWAGLNGAGLNLLLQSTVTAALLIWFVVRETGPARAGLAQ